MINGFFRAGVRFPAPHVRAYVLVPELSRFWGALNFLVDTGSGSTCAHADDTVRQFAVPPARLADASLWQRRETLEGVGGAATYYVVRAQFAFVEDNRSVVRISSDLRIAQLTRMSEQLPSILGWDVLQDFTFSTDWRTRIVRLES
ncbi:MAG TPA: hypothetical protein VIE40_07795 [Dehalococcoidia bacterium]